MKSAFFAGLLASALYSQQAVAGGWNDAQSFTNPENCNNTCTSQQSGGYNFGNVPDGSFSGFDGMGFSGFNCESSFGARKGKRGLTRRTQFSGKAIVAKATTDNNCPKFSSGQDNAFSLTQMHISVDKDSDLTFEYGMPDGSTCKQVSRCSADGTVVTNNQCGGAKQVNIKGDCTFGIHSMIFDCQPPSTSTSTTTTTTTTPLVCKSTETLTGGSCVPTPPPATTTTTTTACADTETLDHGKCIPKTTTTTATTTTPPTTTPTTTTTSCAQTETLVGGKCVPTTTTSATTTTPSGCATTETLIGGKCVPTTTTTPGCATTETLVGGKCVPTTTTTPGCATTETLVGGKCVPFTTTVQPITACKSTETLSGTACVPVTTLTSSLVTTEIVVTTLTTCPVTSTSGTVTVITSTIQTTIITSTATFCPVCGDHPPTTIGSTTVNAPPPIPTPPTTTSQATTTSVPAPTCKDSETLVGGTCVHRTTSDIVKTPPPSPPPVTTSSSPAPPPPPPVTTTSTPAPPPPPPTPTPSCKSTETMANGICIPKTVTGGITTLKSSATTVNPAPPQTPVPEAPCPSLLPRCLATWISKAGSCASNSDISCFCPSPDFISSVQECIVAWGGSDAEIQAAMSFLVGICANFVPKNPGICTGVPSTITLIPTPSATTVTNTLTITNAPHPPPQMPSTMVTFSKTITIGTTTTVTQTVVTVPQVIFSTISKEVTVPGGPTQTSGVGLVPFIPTTSAVGGAPGASLTPAAPNTAFPSSTFGRPDASTAKPNSPIQTFTGSAPVNAYSVVAAGLALLAFLI